MRALVSRQFLSAAPLTEYAASVKGAPTNPTSEQRPSVSFRSRRSVSPVKGNDVAGSWCMGEQGKKKERKDTSVPMSLEAESASSLL